MGLRLIMHLSASAALVLITVLLVPSFLTQRIGASRDLGSW
jgi:hypothetical protein